jgi:hypothetical protein
MRITLLDNTTKDITVREDGYINAEELCNACNKDFTEWRKLMILQKLLPNIPDDTKLSISELIDGIYVHSLIAYQIAYWCKPVYALQIANGIHKQKDQQISKLTTEVNNMQNKLKTMYNRFALLSTMRSSSYIYIETTDANHKEMIYKVGSSDILQDIIPSTEPYYIYIRETKFATTIKAAIKDTLCTYADPTQEDVYIIDSATLIEITNDMIDTFEKVHKSTTHTLMKHKT